MSRARFNDTSTAAAFESQGRGRFSGYVLPPLAVILIGSLLALFAFNAAPQGLNAQAAGSGTPATGPSPEAAVQALLPDGSVSAPSAVDNIPGPPPAPQSLLQMSFPDIPVQAPPAGATALSSIFTAPVQYWGDSISRWAAAAGLDPNLAATVMQIESCGDPSATSGAGAIGLFQVMPYHFAASDSPYDPDTNAARGLDYLRRSLAAAQNDARLAFAGYNGGIGVVSRSEWTWPAETVRYAYWGSGIYADAISGAAGSPRLNEWLTAGGSSLCARAALKLGIDN